MIGMAYQLKAFIALFFIKAIGKNKVNNIPETAGS